MGKTIALAGKLATMTQAEAKSALAALGHYVTGSVSSTTDLLISTVPDGAKVDKALELGIETWDESQLVELLENAALEAEAAGPVDETLAAIRADVIATNKRGRFNKPVISSFPDEAFLQKHPLTWQSGDLVTVTELRYLMFFQKKTKGVVASEQTALAYRYLVDDEDIALALMAWLDEWAGEDCFGADLKPLFFLIGTLGRGRTLEAAESWVMKHLQFPVLLVGIRGVLAVNMNDAAGLSDLRSMIISFLHPNAPSNLYYAAVHYLTLFAKKRGVLVELLNVQSVRFGWVKGPSFQFEISVNSQMCYGVIQPDRSWVFCKDGAMQKTLPSGMTSNESERWTEVRKDVKSTFKDVAMDYDVLMQQRVGEAFGQWFERNRTHAVMRVFVQGVVWRVGEVLFTLDENVQPISVDSEPVTIDDEANVFVAHPIEMGNVKEWLAFFETRGITPLFQQLKRRLFVAADYVNDDYFEGLKVDGDKFWAKICGLSFDMDKNPDSGAKHIRYSKDFAGGYQVAFVSTEGRVVKLGAYHFEKDGVPVDAVDVDPFTFSEARRALQGIADLSDEA